MELIFKTVTGAALAPYIADLARLRMTVFREYPYLYEGSLAYETDYLTTYMASGQAMAILVIEPENHDVVGASTGIPMAAEEAAFRQPLAAVGLNDEAVFYFGESVLLPAYRGRGVYRQFFTRREQYVQQQNQAGQAFTHQCFCAVERPVDHPLRPLDYQPLDAIWQHFGYRRVEGLSTRFDWQDIDQPETTAHPMQYWIKETALS